MPRLCWGRPQRTVRSYSVQHAYALSSVPFVDTDFDVLKGFRFCVRVMSIYLKVRLCHFEFFVRERLGVRHSLCVSFAPLAPCVWVSSATYILYPPPTISLVLSSFPWGAFGCLHEFWALCACFVYRVVGFGYSLPSFSFETDFDFGVARSILRAWPFLLWRLRRTFLSHLCDFLGSLE